MASPPRARHLAAPSTPEPRRPSGESLPRRALVAAVTTAASLCALPSLALLARASLERPGHTQWLFAAVIALVLLVVVALVWRVLVLDAIARGGPASPSRFALTAWSLGTVLAVGTAAGWGRILERTGLL